MARDFTQGQVDSIIHKPKRAKRVPMSKSEAVAVLMTEARTERQPGKNRCARIVRACDALGVKGEDLYHVLLHLDLVRPDTREPWGPYIKRTW
jgi:hypothetical protein